MPVLSWLIERDAAFGAEELAAAFPDIPFDGLRKLLQSCAKGGLLRLLWFPADRRGQVAVLEAAHAAETGRGRVREPAGSRRARSPGFPRSTDRIRSSA